MTDENIELQRLIGEKISITKQITELKAKEDSIKAEIKMNMKALQLERFEDESKNLVTLSSQTRKTVDKKLGFEKFGEAFGEIIKESTFDVLRVTSQESREKAKAFKE